MQLFFRLPTKKALVKVVVAFVRHEPSPHRNVGQGPHGPPCLRTWHVAVAISATRINLIFDRLWLGRELTSENERLASHPPLIARCRTQLGSSAYSSTDGRAY